MFISVCYNTQMTMGVVEVAEHRLNLEGVVEVELHQEVAVARLQVAVEAVEYQMMEEVVGGGHRKMLREAVHRQSCSPFLELHLAHLKPTAEPNLSKVGGAGVEYLPAEPKEHLQKVHSEDHEKAVATEEDRTLLMVQSEPCLADHHDCD
jgi:hypothetical protein